MKPVGRVPRSALENGATVRVTYPPFDVLVAEVEGIPYAIEDACNHAGASLSDGGWRVTEAIEDDPRGACIVCPVHGYVFSLRSGKLVQPLKLCDDQRRFSARIEGSDVVIEDPFTLKILP